jgi:hypothetical protein
MAKKREMKRGTCRMFTRADGSRGKICRLKNGKVVFKGLGKATKKAKSKKRTRR